MGNSIKSESLVEKLSHFVTNLFTSSTGSVKPQGSLDPSALFVKLLTDEDPKSLGEAVVLWSQQFAGKDLRFVFETVSDETIKTTVIHRLIAIKDFNHYRLAIALAESLRAHLHAKLFSQSSDRIRLLSQLKPGQVCRQCRIDSFSEFGAFIELQPRQDALLHWTNIAWHPRKKDLSLLKLGQPLDVVVLEIDDFTGHVLVGLKQVPFALWEAGQLKHPPGSKVKARVIDFIPEGVQVEFDGGLIGIIPLQDLSWGNIAKPSEMIGIGEVVEVLICGCDADKMQFTVSTRLLFPDPWAAIDQRFPVGSVVTGRVTTFRGGHAIIRLPGWVRGELFRENVSWKSFAGFSDVLAYSQGLELKVLENRVEDKIISLGLKQMQPDPWENAADKYPVGMKVNAVVLDASARGARLELDSGIVGNLHIQEISWNRSNQPDPMTLFKRGQNLEVVVFQVDPMHRKIRFSLKRLNQVPFEEYTEKHPPGTRLMCKVCKILGYGALVEMPEGMAGLIHVSDLSWMQRSPHASSFFKIGDEIEVLVLSFDKSEQKINLGLKQLTSDPWEKVDALFPVGAVVRGSVTTVVKFGINVSIGHGFDGLVHMTQIGDEIVGNIKDVLPPGTEVSVRIIDIDKVGRRISLSMRGCHGDQKQQNAKPIFRIVGETDDGN